ncbi:site-specific integrase [Desertivirga xinjiangensis]|uniref:site-specific integrase n=1 Tax=Desertivirga xinjiangensis TaxID=539206 RepID=UPI00210D8292|nr:site-specific integrase [Pedobacter xinjiangensis]
MASVAIVLKTKQKLSNNEFAVALRVTHERVSKYYTLSSLVSDLTLKFKASVEQWRPAQAEDNGLGRFLKAVPQFKELNEILSQKLTLAKDLLKDYDNEGEDFCFERFEADIRTGPRKSKKKNKNNIYLTEHFQSVIEELEQNQKLGLAEVFSSTLSSLKQYKPEALLTDVNVKFLEAYEVWLRTQKKNKDTSISVRLRTIQRAINLAIADKLFKAENYPFGEKKYSVNRRLNHKTRKRAVSIDLISKVKRLAVEDGSALHLAKNIFLFSFYTRGMNFVDIASLKWSDIEDNEIHYIRRKTGQPFDIPVNQHAQVIIDFYKTHYQNKSSYIFPIYNDLIHRTLKQKYTRKKTAIKKVNDSLKEIAKLIGEEGLKLTTYVSRHSYATSLKRSGVATSYISEALGHSTEEMTQTYLDEFEKGVITELESKIFDF